ncbi:MAG: flippase-like domain-containing protein [candidate division WS1 bacterium]|nr:flippase-like domain-containing protein [candidate division WS1 bacterium]
MSAPARARRRPRRWGPPLRVALGFVVSGVALWAVLRQVQWVEIVQAMDGANLALILLGAVLYPWRLVVVSWRWGELFSLYTDRPPSFRFLLRITSIGYLLNNLLPLRSGDIFRGGMAVREGCTLKSAVSSLLLEKVVDVWWLVGLALICGSAYLSQDHLLAQSLRAVALVAGLVLLTLIVLAASGRAAAMTAWCERRESRAGRPVAKLARVTEETCGLLRRPRVLGLTILATALNWAIEGGFYMAIAHSLGLQLTPSGALFMVAVIGLGLSVPSAAGGIGLSQYLAVLVLRLQGMELRASTAYSLLSWVVGYLVIGLAGLGALLTGTLAGGQQSKSKVEGVDGGPASPESAPFPTAPSQPQALPEEGSEAGEAEFEDR